jgi:hypothetical protein
MIGAGQGTKKVVASPSAADGTAPLVSNLFRIGIFTRCDSTKSMRQAGVQINTSLSPNKQVMAGEGSEDNLGVAEGHH